MAKMKWYDYTVIGLLIAGGLNWGLLGSFNFNLVETLLGAGMLSKLVYIAVGLSSLYSLYWLFFGKK